MKQILFLVFLGLVPSFVLAQTSSNPPENPPEAVVVATVNVEKVKIINQENNTFTLAFDITNRVGAQGQIRYGAYLVKEGSGEKIAPVVYDGVVSIPAGGTFHKEERYQAPGYLASGEYALMLELRNSEGLPLGSAQAGKFNLTKDENALSFSSQCQLEKSKNVAKASNLVIQCQLTSSASQTLTATVTTYQGSEYGEEVKTEKKDTLNLVAGANTFNFSTQAVATPGSYLLVIHFNGPESAHYIAPSLFYTIEGASAAITNVVFDKAVYQREETARLSVLWAEPIGQSEAALLEVRMSGKSGETCSEMVSQVLSSEQTYITFSVPVTQECENPVAWLVIKDSAGNILGEAEYGVESPQVDAPLTETLPTWVKATWYYFLILILIIGSFLLFKRFKGKSPMYIFLFFLFGASIFLGAPQAEADTIMVNGWPIEVNNLDIVPGGADSQFDTGTGIYPNSIASVQKYYNGQCYFDVYGYSDSYGNPTHGPDASGGYFNLSNSTGNFDISTDTIHFEQPYNCSSASTSSGTIQQSIKHPSLAGPYAQYTGPGNYYEARWNFRIGRVFVQYRDYFNIVINGGCGYDYASAVCSNHSQYCPGKIISNQSPACATASGDPLGYGTMTNVTTTSEYTSWQCSGTSNGGSTASCMVYKPDAECGPAYYTTTPTAPSTGLCTMGTPSAVTAGGSRWEWTCSGAHYQPYCFAWNASAGPQTGQCGPAATTYASGSTSYSGAQCTVGTPSATPTFPTSGNSATWTCSGVAGGSLSGTCTATHSTTVTPSDSLKICQNSCNSGILRGIGGATTGFALSVGGSQNLVACYGTATDCNGSPFNDVTDETNWSEGGSSVVSLSGFDPKVVTGNNSGTEAIQASYKGLTTATMNVTVACVPTVTCNNAPGRENYCESETFSADNGCGTSIDCSGTRTCNYNWTEVAP